MTEVSGLAQLLATTVPPRPLTVDDLLERPEDGWRYELVDGSLIMSPPPTMRHDTANSELLEAVMDAARPTYKVRKTDIGIHLDDGTYFIPDIVVLRTDADLSGPGFRPQDVVLVVEVVSPTNAANDLVLKRHVYARHGIRHYWLLDSRGELRMTVLELDGSGTQYAVAHEIEHGQSVTLEKPFGITLAPKALGV